MFSKPDLKYKVEDPKFFFEIDHEILLQMTEVLEEDNDDNEETETECDECTMEKKHESLEDKIREHCGECEFSAKTKKNIMLYIKTKHQLTAMFF